MKIAVLKEIQAGEQRVAASPDSIRHLVKLGYSLVVEAGAGEAADFGDDVYKEAGAEIASDANALWQQSDIILKVKGPTSARSRVNQ